MALKYLIDTNAAIEYLNDRLPNNVANLIEDTGSQISVLTSMKLLAWPKATAEHILLLQAYINVSVVHTLDESIIVNAICIRKKYGLKLPDAIIAATILTMTWC